MTTFTLNQIVLNSVLTAVQSVFGGSIRGVTRNWEDKIIAQLKKEIEKMNVVYAGDLSNHNYFVDRLTQYKKAMGKYNGFVLGQTSWYK